MDTGEWRVYEWAGLTLRVYTHPCVYEPSDDSRLAVEALAAAYERWGRVPVAVDLGSGTGILGLAVHEIYGAHVVAVDLNPWAVEASAKTLAGKGSVARCNWGSCIASRVGLAVSNPPYLPVGGELGECGGWLEKAWSHGRSSVERACREAARLAPRVVLVYSSLSGFDVESCLESLGYTIILRLEERFFMERLYAIAAEERGVGSPQARAGRD